MKKKVLKVLIILLSIGVLAFVTYKFWPIIKTLSTTQGQIEFRDKISSLGVLGPVLLFLLESVQMVFVILPGEPIEVLYGMCFGTIYGAFLLTLAVFIDTVIIYFLVKKFGRKLLVFFFSEEKIKKVEDSNWFNNNKRIENILLWLFFLPGTPKDLVLYIACMTKLSAWKIILISTFVRFPSVITSTMAGDNLVSGNIHISILIYVIMGIILLLIKLFVNKFSKNKETKEALKTFE